MIPPWSRTEEMGWTVKRTSRNFHGTTRETIQSSSNKAVNDQMLRELDKNYWRRMSL